LSLKTMTEIWFSVQHTDLKWSELRPIVKQHIGCKTKSILMAVGNSSNNAILFTDALLKIQENHKKSVEKLNNQVYFLIESLVENILTADANDDRKLMECSLCALHQICLVFPELFGNYISLLHPFISPKVSAF
jgi:hypothetical protein